MQGVLSPDQICSALAVEDDDMRLREDDRKWISDEITRQVGRGIGAAVEEFKPHGLAKAVFILRQLGPIATIIAVFVAVIAIAATQFNLANTRLAKQASFETKTDKRLDDIEGTLKEIQGDLAKQSIISHASLPLSDFKATLPDLSSAITTVQKQNLALSPMVIDDLRQKFVAVDTTTPGYWPTVLQFLQFASAGLAPANVPPPGAKPNIRTSFGNWFDHNGVVGATVMLDGGVLVDDHFENCRVIFTNTPVKMTNVTFVNSIFEFPVSSVPTPYIQHASKLLLASDLKTASIPSL
jgi:hypothetical protein